MAQFTRYALLALSFAVFSAPQAVADVCLRQNLAGVWVNPSPVYRPPERELVRIEIRYYCEGPVFWMRAIDRIDAEPRTDGRLSTRAELIGEQDQDRPTRIGAGWTRREGCGIGSSRFTDKFTHVIVTWKRDGLHVVYRGRYCVTNAPFLRRYVFQRGS